MKQINVNELNDNVYYAVLHESNIPLFKKGITNVKVFCIDYIRFTTYKELPKILSNGNYILKIKIPKDADVFAATNMIDTYYTNLIDIECFYHQNNNFKEWFDAEKYNYSKYSSILASKFAEHFDVWWNSEKFNNKFTYLLASYCSKHFNVWWNPDTYNWFYSSLLPVTLAEYFDIWWNPDKFTFDLHSISMLNKYCRDKKDIWVKYIPDEYINIL